MLITHLVMFPVTFELTPQLTKPKWTSFDVLWCRIDHDFNCTKSCTLAKLQSKWNACIVMNESDGNRISCKMWGYGFNVQILSRLGVSLAELEPNKVNTELERLVKCTQRWLRLSYQLSCSLCFSYTTYASLRIFAIN